MYKFGDIARLGKVSSLKMFFLWLGESNEADEDHKKVIDILSSPSDALLQLCADGLFISNR